MAIWAPNDLVLGLKDRHPKIGIFHFWRYSSDFDTTYPRGPDLQLAENIFSHSRISNKYEKVEICRDYGLKRIFEPFFEP